MDSHCQSSKQKNAHSTANVLFQRLPNENLAENVGNLTGIAVPMQRIEFVMVGSCYASFRIIRYPAV